jgi:MFS transporter, SHS family, lactate transporter
MRNNMAIGWFYSPSQIKRYLLTRPSSLKPPGTKLRNPIAVLRELDRHQWLMFLAGFLGWTWDAFDFFTVSLTVTELAESFGKTNAQVSWVSGPLLVFVTVRRESVHADDMYRG